MPVESATADLLNGARDALSRHAWVEAFDLFTRADQERQLAGADLQGLADAAWFTGQADLSIAAKERAFQAFQTAGEKEKAASVALELQTQYGYKG